MSKRLFGMPDLKCLAFAVAVVLGISPMAQAQSVCLPLPRLLTTMPMGGAVGSEFEVTISGENIDGAGELQFSTPAITATPKLGPSGAAEPNKYVVKVTADCAPGLYEARLMTRLGISSSRIFCIDTLKETKQETPNLSLATAKELPINSVCNAVMSVKAVDHYSFEAKKGERYVVNCASRGIDSKLDAVLIVADAMGRDLVVERRGGMLDFTAQQSGKHIIKVHELTFKGGPAYYYRLSVQSIAKDAPLPVFASTSTVSSFSWPPVGLPADAAQKEQEPNNTAAQVQKITLPCDIAGSFFPAADVDVFEFAANKGDVWWIEVASERLGRPTDPSVLVQRVMGEGAEQKVVDVAEFSDIPAPIRPSSNGYAYDGPPYDGGSADVLGKLEVKEDGIYRLQLLDLFGGTRFDNRNVYRLVIRKAAPDFALAAWGLHMELRNGDRNALSKPLALRAGITTALEVVAVRRDGFDGDIELSMEGLPVGVTAQGLKIPAGKSRGIMLITADESAPAALTHATFTGKAIVNGTEVSHPVQMAAMAWPIVDSWGEIPHPRLVSGMPVSVTRSEMAPLTIKPVEKKVWEVVAGQKLTVPLTHVRRSEFSGATLQLKVSGNGFEQVPRFDVNLTADKSEAVFDLAALKTPPGEYLISLFGSAVAKYRYNPEAIPAAEAELAKAKENAAAISAEVAQLTTVAASAPSDKKAEADKAVADANVRKQAADAAVTAATAKLKGVTDQAAPRDTVEIILSEPIAIRVKPVEGK